MGGGRVAAAVTIALVALVGSAEARGISAHFEGGFGPTIVRPLEEESAPGATVCVGATLPLTGVLRTSLELAATSGGPGPATSAIPEDSQPGDRSLATALLGVEMAGSRQSHGPFAFIGAGAGRSTLRNARGVFEPPYGDRWIIPTRNLTAFAFGAGAGYRFAAGPGPLHLQLALRVHALASGGQIPASASALTIGLAY